MQKKLTRTMQKHQDIIEAAKKEFSEFGFLAANMDRVSISAEVSKRTLYRHFASKEILFESVLISISSAVNQKFSYSFDKTKSLKMQLTEIVNNEINNLYDIYGIPLARTIVMEFLRQSDTAPHLIEKIYSVYLITEWIKGAIEAKQIHDIEPKIITDVYASLFHGLFFWPQVMQLESQPEGLELQQKIETLLSVFLQAYQVK